jgi:hypothetical protein
MYGEAIFSLKFPTIILLFLLLEKNRHELFSWRSSRLSKQNRFPGNANQSVSPKQKLEQWVGKSHKKVPKFYPKE